MKKILIFILVILCIYFAVYKPNHDKEKVKTEEVSTSVEKQDNIEISENDKNEENNNDNTQENIKTKEAMIIPRKEINSFTTDWQLILINKNNRIPDNYSVKLTNIENNQKVDYRIAGALENMLKDARKVGIDPMVCSSYRTNNKQKELYNNKINQYLNQGYNKERAIELASYWVTLPNASEHEIGLAVDIISRIYQKLDKKQETTEVQRWLRENSYKYGFVVRYPPEKSEITLINNESWHYRYVGIENAKYMYENNMCLEEYIDYLKQFEN